jgi:hypothetical protein
MKGRTGLESEGDADGDEWVGRAQGDKGRCGGMFGKNTNIEMSSKIRVCENRVR